MMDQALIAEIAGRVLEKLAAAGFTPDQIKLDAPADADQPGLLIITDQHAERCHSFLTDPELNRRFRVVCALNEEYAVDPDGFASAMLFHLDIGALCRLATGVCGSPAMRLAQKMLLSGKRVYVPCEEIELFQIEDAVPAAYLAQLRQYLNLLIESGVEIGTASELKQRLLGASAAAACTACESAGKTASGPANEVRIDKRVITEKDLTGANLARKTVIRLNSRAIITDLARDYAKDMNLSLLRD